MSLQAQAMSTRPEEGAAPYPDVDDLMDLTGYRGGTRISLFLPLRGAGADHAETRLRLKHLMRPVARTLRSEGVRGARASHLLTETKALLDEVAARPTNAGGVAVFIGANRVRYVLTPARLPELVAVGDRFTIAPLLPAYATDGRSAVRAAVARFHEMQGTGHTKERPRDVVAAAERGEVQTLLMTESLGRPSSPARSPLLRLGGSADPAEQVERAVLATVRGGGEVFLVPDAALGHGAVVAAIVRGRTPEPA